MPILSGSVTFSRFHAPALGFAKGSEVVLEGVKVLAFKPLQVADGEDRCAGFVELEDHDATEFGVGTVFKGSLALFSYRIDELKVHPASLKAGVERWTKAFVAEHERPPGRLEKLDAKNEIRASLRPSSPIVTKTHDVSWDLATGEVLIWAASQGAVDEVQDAVERAFDVRLRPVSVVTTADDKGVDARALAPTAALHVGAGSSSGSDETEVEQGRAREQFLTGKAYLGREFLTWLLWRSEFDDLSLENGEEPLVVRFVDSLTLRGIAGDVVEETIRGALSPYSPLVRRSLDRGLLIHAARLRLEHGDRVYSVSLNADLVDFRGAKLPALMAEEEDDRIAERLYLAGQLTFLTQSLLDTFLLVRASPEWADTAEELKGWMFEGAESV